VLRRRAADVVRDLGERRRALDEQPLREPDPRGVELGLKARRGGREVALQRARGAAECFRGALQ